MITFLLLFAVFGISVAAQDEKPVTHPIDAAQAKCLKTHHGTMPRAKCYSDASGAWNEDVTKTYAALLLKVSATDKGSIEKSQTAWGKYRDAEYDLISHFYGNKRGTGYISVRIIARMEIVKERALRLEDWLATASE